MAQIDLRHADVYLKDGYTAVGAVNGTPANGDTSVTVDGFTLVIPNGNQFTVVGSTRHLHRRQHGGRSNPDLDHVHPGLRHRLSASPPTTR